MGTTAGGQRQGPPLADWNGGVGVGRPASEGHEEEGRGGRSKFGEMVKNKKWRKIAFASHKKSENLSSRKCYYTNKPSNFVLQPFLRKIK